MKYLIHSQTSTVHDDIIEWKHFPRYWPFERGIHRPPMNSPHKGQWRGALMFSFICAWINGWVNNREAGDLRRHRTHYDVTVMLSCLIGEAVVDQWYSEVEKYDYGTDHQSSKCDQLSKSSNGVGYANSWNHFVQCQCTCMSNEIDKYSWNHHGIFL